MESADDFKRRLRNRFVEVAAGGRNRTADRNRTRFAVAQAHDTGAFVKGCDIGFEIGGERFFARDLFEAAAHFAQRLRPARSGIGKQKHVESHLAIVFGKGNARVDGRFARGDGHG